MEICGYTWGYYESHRGDFASARAAESREKLMADGINWACVAFVVMQRRFCDTRILFDYARDIPDAELLETVRHFHRHHVKVCLKPMINLEDGLWRARISFPEDDDADWDAWFRSYGAFLSHYAELAERAGAEMFCLGCEMLGTERQEKRWRRLIAQIRQVYHGLLTYNTNHGEELVARWYDAIDVIGTSGYFPVADKPGASLEEMEAAWRKVAAELKQVSERWRKPLFFAEIGCRSAAGCACTPWDEGHDEYPRDEEEQARFMESCLKVFGREPWFLGFFWWAWHTFLPENPGQDKGFDIYGKKAEGMIRAYYLEAQKEQKPGD